MRTRFRALAAALLLALPTMMMAAEPETTISTSNLLENVPGVVHRMTFFESADEWRAGETSNVEVWTSAPLPTLVLADPNAVRFPRRGTWTSPEVVESLAFTEFLPSWNADVPEETGVQFEARVRDAETGEWSPWLYFGQWGRTPTSPRRQVSFDGGAVHVDVLRLTRAADAWQTRVRFTAFNFDAEQNPAVRRVAVCTTGQSNGDIVASAGAADVELPPGWLTLPVPFTPQRDGPAGIGGSICSPTSVKMVMDYYGIVRPLEEHALAIYDRDYGIFGNWSRATQRAAELGLSGYVTRFAQLDEVKLHLTRGRPVIASIRFRRGEMPSAPYNSTNGHLIVIRGFTEDGDLVINDPASRDRGEAIVYTREEMQRNWLDRGGVAYVITPAGER